MEATPPLLLLLLPLHKLRYTPRSRGKRKKRRKRKETRYLLIRLAGLGGAVRTLGKLISLSYFREKNQLTLHNFFLRPGDQYWSVMISVRFTLNCVAKNRNVRYYHEKLILGLVYKQKQEQGMRRSRLKKQTNIFLT